MSTLLSRYTNIIDISEADKEEKYVIYNSLYGAISFLSDVAHDNLNNCSHGMDMLDQKLREMLFSRGYLVEDRESEDLFAELTPREWEVLQLVGHGLTNREAADRLAVTEHTVKFHMRGILGKLHLRNRAQVAAWVAEYEHRDMHG